MNWYVFSTHTEDAEESLEVFGSYCEAVLEAQGRHDTASRPRRRGRGFYTVYGENHSSYVASIRAMDQQGFGNLLNSQNQMPRRNMSYLYRKTHRRSLRD